MENCPFTITELLIISGDTAAPLFQLTRVKQWLERVRTPLYLRIMINQVRAYHCKYDVAFVRNSNLHQYLKSMKIDSPLATV